jgi:hypothetical protein
MCDAGASEATMQPVIEDSIRPRVLIFSYWTSPTDLAAILGDWPEFRGGSGYNVDLHALRSGETVEVRLVRENDDCWLLVAANATGALFERALGRITLELARTSSIQLHTVDTPTAIV